MPEGHTIHRLARDHHRWFGDTSVMVDSLKGFWMERNGSPAVDLFERQPMVNTCFMSSKPKAVLVCGCTFISVCLVDFEIARNRGRNPISTRECD